MGSIFRPDDQSVHLLLPATIVGRSPDATVRIEPGKATVSREHCLISWRPEGWNLIPLSTRSATCLNGRPLRERDTVLLQPGDRIALGTPPVELVIQQVEPPTLWAGNRENGAMYLSGPQGLELPGIVLRQSPSAGWEIHRPTGAEKLDLSELKFPTDTIRVDGWDIGMIHPGDETVFSPPRVDELQLVLLPMRNLESVRLLLRTENWEVDLGHRAEFYPLYILALARKEGGDGWLETALLTKRVGDHTWPTVEAYLSRVGGMVQRAGVADGRSLIESAHKMRRIRLPPDQILIQQET